MAALPYMPLYVSDYLRDTTTLSCEQHGAYLLLIMGMWNAGGSLPNDDAKIARIARLPLTRWKKMRDDVLAFFVISGAVLTHKKVQSVIAHSQKISQLRSQAGKQKAPPKSLKSPEQTPAIAEQLIPQLPAIVSSNINTNPLTAQPLTVTREAVDEGAAAALCVTLGKRITDLMGVTDDPRWLGNWSVVQIWLAQGFDPEKDIWPSVSATVARKKQTGQAMPGSLKYFTKIIEENHKARLQSGASPIQRQIREMVVVKRGSPAFAAWIAWYRKGGKRTKFLETQEILTVPTEYPGAVAA